MLPIRTRATLSQRQPIPQARSPYVHCRALSLCPKRSPSGDDHSQDLGKRLVATGVRKTARPNDNDIPAGGGESPLVSAIPRDVSLEFAPPKLKVSLGHRRFGATMTMPETPAHFNDRLPFWQHDVGLSRKAPIANAKAEAVSEKERSNDLFRQRVLAADGRHDFRPRR